MEGGILHEWAAKQQEYYDWLQCRNTGKRWLTNLIKKLWEISWNMWEQRNGELKNPASPAALREHARLDAAIAQEYTDTIQLAKRDRRWFCRPKEVLFTEPLEYKQQWIESVGLACACFARRNNTSTQTQRNLMRSTFRRTAIQATTPNQST
jgi:tRNA A37 N6-isopentenylltransferase MiaA